MSVVVLTYDHPHRKTEDVVWRLVSVGHLLGDLSIVAIPWVDRPQRRYLYGHRPAEKHWPCEPTIHPRDYFCKYEVAEKGDLYDRIMSKDPDVVVIGGAGILPKEIVQEFTVINIHPGLLPARRGLDVLKWSVIDCKRVGVTAHVCDEHTDLGWRLIEKEVPIYPEDSFHSFAMRQYEYELNTLVPAVKMVLEQPDRSAFDRIAPGETKAFKRMPVRIEAGLMEAFERYKMVYS